MKMEKVIKLYPGIAPGSENLNMEEEIYEDIRFGAMKKFSRNVTAPDMTAFIPEGGKDMSAVIIIAGGGFKRQSLGLEGYDVAAWLNSHGIAAFVLKTRLPMNEHAKRYDVLLMDAQRAVRIVRANAKEWGIREDSIGVMGFSAGGYQAALVSTGFDINAGGIGDEIDKLSARPDFCVLCYPVTSGRVPRNVGENNPIADYEIEQVATYKVVEMVSEQTPPLFIFETDDDTTTPAENSLLFYQAARANKVPAELHIFRNGKHGFGLGDDAAQTGQWKGLFLKWFETIV